MAAISVSAQPTVDGKPGGGVARAAGRLDFLDALRGIAVLAVFVQHAAIALTPDFTDFAMPVFSDRFSRYVNAGQFGVLLFFLCSGFIIPASIERHRAPRAFWTSRFFRLYPAYWVALAASLVLTATHHYAVNTAAQGYQPFDAIINATMLQGYFGAPDILIVAWTLTLELIFYAFVTALVMLGLERQIPLIAVGLLLLVALLVGGLPHLLGPHNYAASAQRIFLFATMFVGTAAYQAVNGRLSRLTATAIGALGLASIGLCHWAAGQGQIGPGLTPPYLRAWLGAYLVFGLALLARQRQFPTWLTGVGRISYSIYLLNVLVIVALPRNANALLSLLRWVVVTLTLSGASYYLIERPCIALGRRALPRGASGITRPSLGRLTRVIAPTVSFLAALFTFLIVVELGVYGIRLSRFTSLLHILHH